MEREEGKGREGPVKTVKPRARNVASPPLPHVKMGEELTIRPTKAPPTMHQENETLQWQYKSSTKLVNMHSSTDTKLMNIHTSTDVSQTERKTRTASSHKCCELGQLTNMQIKIYESQL